MVPRLDHFIPDRDAPAFNLLGSFLSSPPASVAEKYIAAYTAPGDLIIDPFATTPAIARLALQIDRRAIAFESNPLWAWVARALATIPAAPEINATLARLGDAMKDDAPLRSHIAHLYDTRCSACSQLTPVDYFIHQRDEGPVHRHYTCAHCGAVRDEPATPDDIERFKRFDAKGMHYHLAFERVVPEDQLWANRIRNLLDLYTPRNLYALVTLTIKGDTLLRTPIEKQILNLVLLHLLDRGAALYSSVAEPARFSRHKQFIEFNLWREAENVAHELGKTNALALADTPKLVAEIQMPSVWLGRASVRKVSEEIAPSSAALVLAALPARRAAMGALSYFWGAWTLKRSAVRSLVPFLDPQTSDPAWERSWYLESLAATMNALAKILRPDGRAVFIFEESNYETIEALLLSAVGANIDLDNFIFQPHSNESPRRIYDHMRASYRLSFTSSQQHQSDDSARTRNQTAPEKARGGGAADLKKQIQSTALLAARDILTQRGEPLAFSWLHHAAYTRAAREGLLRAVMRANFKSATGRFVFQSVLEGLSEGYTQDFDHLGGLWLRRLRSSGPLDKTDPPLIDRVEKEVREIIDRERTNGSSQSLPSEVNGNTVASLEGESPSRDKIEDEVYEKFSGDLTPEEGLIDLCIRAAARENFAEERTRAMQMVRGLGERLGYAVAQNVKPFDWTWTASGEIAHGFVWRERPAFADLARLHIAPARGYLIIPESQVELLREKVRRLPLLVDAYRDAGWDYVRVPSLMKLLEKEPLERSDLVLMPGLVPMVAEPSAQLELL